ncbi:conserved protein, unknown function [Hepatocystis sp. ex Piliocolobus tephrosceles]|nr:conserved protein, unknown function [Hepatocystis sp. ex Piliocolobus tephrosceles]
MALLKKKNKTKSNGVIKKKKGKKNTAIQMDNDLISNPFTEKEEIKPFDLNIEDENIDEEEQEKEKEKETFEKLLNKKSKYVDKCLKKKIKRGAEFEGKQEDDIEDVANSWYEQHLINDIPTKLTSF